LQRLSLVVLPVGRQRRRFEHFIVFCVEHDRARRHFKPLTIKPL
jgi:hypothetical protein